MPHRESYPLSDTDARGKDVTVEAPPRRIVSLVPSQTELLVHLGLRDHLVGVTRFCVHPPGLKEYKEVVGGTKNVCCDRVRELKPDFILANREENTQETVEALEDVAPVYVTNVSDLPTAVDMIRSVGRLVQRREYAGSQARKIMRLFRKMPHYQPTLLTAYLIWRDPYMTVGHDTFIHDVMRYAGLINIFGKCTRYPEITPTDLSHADPDLILLPDEPFPFKQEHVRELRSSLPDTPIQLVSGRFFSWYGSCLLKMPKYLRALREKIEAQFDFSHLME